MRSEESTPVQTSHSNIKQLGKDLAAWTVPQHRHLAEATKASLAPRCGDWLVRSAEQASRPLLTQASDRRDADRYFSLSSLGSHILETYSVLSNTRGAGASNL